jgi:hypothetical protein
MMRFLEWLRRGKLTTWQLVLLSNYRILFWAVVCLLIGLAIGGGRT